MSAQHNDDALKALMPDLMRLALILAPNRDIAEDLAQEALLNVWARLANGGEIDDLRPYLMTVLRRASRRRGWHMVALDDVDEPCVAGRAMTRIACGEVIAALKRLPPAQADLIADFATGRSYADLARARGLPSGTIMSRLARARTRLRREMSLEKDDSLKAWLDELGS